VKAPARLVVALSLTAWPVPPPHAVLCPSGEPRAYLGYRQGELIAFLAQPARISRERGSCGTADSGNLEWDPGQRGAFRCWEGRWDSYPGVNIVLTVESGTLEEIP